MLASHSLFNLSRSITADHQTHLGSDPESSDNEQGDELKWSLLVEASCQKIKPWGADSSDNEGDAPILFQRKEAKKGIALLLS